MRAPIRITSLNSRATVSPSQAVPDASSLRTGTKSASWISEVWLSPASDVCPPPRTHIRDCKAQPKLRVIIALLRQRARKLSITRTYVLHSPSFRRSRSPRSWSRFSCSGTRSLRCSVGLCVPATQFRTSQPKACNFVRNARARSLHSSGP